MKMNRFLFACALALSSSTLNADDWTQWRGNDRDGKSAEKGLADSWPASGPKQLWRVDGLGGGFSTPSAADGTLYLLVNQGMDHEEIVALSVDKGAKLWTTKIGAVGKNDGPQYPGARSTPTIDGDSLYILGSAGDLVCLDTKSGARKWSKNLPADFKGKPGQWAYTESPLIDGDALICSPGGAEATVVALNKKDGSLIWKSALPDADDASYSSPVITEVNGVKQYVLYLAKGVVGLEADSGKLLWRYENTADKNANVQTPVASSNFVYTAAGRVGGGLVDISGGTKQPKEVYFAKAMPSGMGGSILVDGSLYGSSGETLMSIDYVTGKTNWQVRSIGAAALCFADGKLYLHGENNDVAMVAATPEKYTELGKFTPENAPDRGNSKAWVHPIIVDGKLIIRDVGTIWCYDIRG